MQPNDTAPRKRSPRSRIEVTCEACGAVFTARPSVVEKGHARFCGRTCHDLAKRGGRARVCEHCRSSYRANSYEFRRRAGHFCTQACFDEFQQLAALKRTSNVLMTCEQCGTLFTRWPSHIEDQVRQFCSRACYDAMRRTDANATREGRLWRYVDRTGECWLWKRSTTGSGYGQFVVGHGRNMPAHRAAWEIATGETLTPDDAILHTCDVKLCCRNNDIGWYQVGGVLLPRRGHLAKGTLLLNNRDMMAKGRSVHGSRHRMARLTDDDVRLMRSLYAEGCYQDQLAAMFGVSQSVVSSVILRKTWKHVV